MEINGIAHVILTVRSVPRSRAFYRALLAHLGLTEIVDSDTYLYWVGGRTAIGIRPASPELATDAFDQGRPGLHHVCFRCRSRDDVDSIHRSVVDLGAKVVHAPEEGPWVSGYYSVLFEDPDGIRFEANYVPGKGVLAEGAKRGDAALNF
jgi:catechol 2,3-dioxygenase-like lactoylglutathione lyase family enzyme